MTKKYPEKALFSLLQEFASGRIYALRAPENPTKPFIVFQRTNSTRERAINNPVGLADATIQVDVYADDLYAAKDLAALVENKLDGYRDTVYYGVNSPQDFVRIAGISVQNEFDLLDDTVEPFLYRDAIILNVKYEQ